MKTGRFDRLGVNRLLALKRVWVVYLIYFFLAQPIISYVFPDWYNGGQVFQLVEEEDSIQNRILEERICNEPENNFVFLMSNDLCNSTRHLYFYYQGLYKSHKSETPNPPPEQFVKMYS
jgi:hypothetical protein